MTHIIRPDSVDAADLEEKPLAPPSGWTGVWQVLEPVRTLNVVYRADAPAPAGGASS